jgi:SIT4 phosphatase-associated protein
LSSVVPQVSSILGGALDSGSDGLVTYLFRECNLLDWLCSAPTEVTPLPNPGDERAAERSPLRAGYLGHLTQVANKLQSVASKRELVGKFLADSPEWLKYVEDRLKARNEVSYDLNNHVASHVGGSCWGTWAWEHATSI